jgi:hypothetical protein
VQYRFVQRVRLNGDGDLRLLRIHHVVDRQLLLELLPLLLLPVLLLLFDNER